ncbi:hypothetical protein Patl1_04151 [Pistacia atlantica]|uniref:Uncharacterized protein n=1 Tax=Pistacia atlantica TaxID=434234 RepID=A0ACC1BSQ2_9ROSI|nr:hypothetical protein Patl1_04151 [Pistacia atlantica]
MIYLLFTIVLTEMSLILILLFRNPLRNLLVMALDLLKQGTGPLIARTVGATVVVVFTSTLFTAMEIQKRSKDGGVINPTDEVLMANLLLQSSLMGFSLFLALMVDRLHYYIKEVHLVRRQLEQAMNINKDHEESKKAKVSQLDPEDKS